MDNLQFLLELKRAYEEAEGLRADAYRRAVWLEKHLYDAHTEEEFNARLASLKAQEEELRKLSLQASQTRETYVRFEMRLQE